MIFTSLANAGQNDLSAERFQKALEFLARPDLAELAPGRHDVMGDEVFANVQELTTTPAAEKNYEAHRRYADIHYVVKGSELMGIADVNECEAIGGFNDADDFGLYAAPARESWVTLREGDLVVTPPADAHKPGCCPGEPAPLKKICVKVLVV